jgi:hypothetical protein
MNNRLTQLTNRLIGIGFHINKKPDFDVTESHTVLEFEGRYKNMLRVILNTQGEDEGCSVEVICFNRNYVVLWKSEFDFQTPIDMIIPFFKQFTLNS